MDLHTNGDDRTPDGGDRPRVGGWGWAIALLGLLGAGIGYFSTRSDDQRRANHIMKWGLIWTIPSVVLWTAAPLLVLGGFVFANNSDAPSGSSRTDMPTSLAGPTTIALPADVMTSECPLLFPSPDAEDKTVTDLLVKIQVYAVDNHHLGCARKLLNYSIGDPGFLFQQDHVIIGDRFYNEDPGDKTTDTVPRNVPGTSYLGFLRSSRLEQCSAERCIRAVYKMRWPTGEVFEEYNVFYLGRDSQTDPLTWTISAPGYLTTPR